MQSKNKKMSSNCSMKNQKTPAHSRWNYCFIRAISMYECQIVVGLLGKLIMKPRSKCYNAT